MQQKVDVRNQLGIVVSIAGDLIRALMVLPEREDEMRAALKALPREEKVITDDYLLRMSQQFYELRQRTQWLRHRVQESLHKEG
jgi:hypothetical protein